MHDEFGGPLQGIASPDYALAHAPGKAPGTTGSCRSISDPRRSTIATRRVTHELPWVRMRYIPLTRTNGIWSDGPFVPPIVIPFLSVLALAVWVTYKAIAN